MRKIYKSSDDNDLTIYASMHPFATWDDFRDFDSGNVYKVIKKKIFHEQYELCAYCESDLSAALANNRRVEHFQSKSDGIEDGRNIHLDWFNLLGVCVGGSDYENMKVYELPFNLSCDAHKAHLESTQKNLDKNWNGKVISPLTIPEHHILFKFEKSTGKLFPDPDYCSMHKFSENQFETTEELVNETIRVFNLNCDRLNKARLQVFYFLQKQIKLARKTNNLNQLKRFVNSWNRDKPLSFQTTRDILLREYKQILAD
ncbi:TIGR02646 family protein [Shewanella sp. DNRA4]|uniref:retron Ec78 anti-phage system effector HNH endonuclease PtuB n=1 Tax=Shewanella sp. DNRA4 TaxID=2723055 RepID=UPI00146F940D|nr:retron Ec78 anti-phage system effector HNH endonuclease PtuB [Shewanella sp. DNRA4]NMD53204.1 TIGR02646 family protein [Shewanella sp. DNRA4]